MRDHSIRKVERQGVIFRIPQTEAFRVSEHRGVRMKASAIAWDLDYTKVIVLVRAKSFGVVIQRCTNA